MSTLLYGARTRQRLVAPARSELVTASVEPGGNEVLDATTGKAKETVKDWQDALAALVPAEVLALHAVAMNLGTTTDTSGGDPVTTINDTGEMQLWFWGFVGLSVLLYFAGAKKFSVVTVAGAFVPPLAFVCWTMVQPTTAFDALGVDLSTMSRTLLAGVGAVLLGLWGTLVAAKADAATG